MPTRNKHKLNQDATVKVMNKVDVKSEPNEIYPLSHYVGDRVELLQQIFLSVKAKTIKSIAPSFLQDKSIDTIQELCLDELLGISKKRLLAIINATTCPTDTDTSDSDVENVEEHISLEEISSESEAEQHAVPAKQSKPSEKKELSVLELLELQARARAIRSQLALEPVTKIELDSDDNCSQESQPKTSVGNSNASKPKPVRLKRNFRQRQTQELTEENKNNSEIDEPKEDSNSKSDSNQNTAANVSNENVKTMENVSNDDIKNETINITIPQRTPSPDVITIIPSPEMLYISSDDEEKPTNSFSSRYMETVTISLSKREETEDEKFLRKIKESNTFTTIAKNDPNLENINDTISNANVEQTVTNPEDVEATKSPSKPDANDEMINEPEEGELTESDDDEDNEKTIPIEILDDDLSKKVEDSDVAIKNDDGIKESSLAQVVQVEEEEEEEEEEQHIEMIEIDDAEDEDVIDLGKDEELFFDLRTDLEEDKTVESNAENEMKSMEDESTQEESWGARWLKGHKITKIMATSKLANRMRSKIKQKKNATIEEQQTPPQNEEMANTSRAAIEDPVAQFEEGSVQQYKEICKEHQ